MVDIIADMRALIAKWRREANEHREAQQECINAEPETKEAVTEEWYLHQESIDRLEYNADELEKIVNAAANREFASASTTRGEK